MSHYRRPDVGGAIYFFTVVTYERQPILTLPPMRQALREALTLTATERPFVTIAMVLLPDHLHCLWQLPEHDADFGTRWRLIKARATRAVAALGLGLADGGPSRARRREHTVWQRRFWEHLIRDDDDFRRHADYIHYNPVKHGYVRRPDAWPYSTFAKFVRRGWYGPDWGAAEPESIAGWEAAGE